MKAFKIAVIAAALALAGFCLGVGTLNQNYAQNQQPGSIVLREVRHISP